MTNQNYTFNVLDSYFLNTYNNSLNIGYLRDQVFAQLDIVWRNEHGYRTGKSYLTEALLNKRRSVHSLVWLAFMEFANDAIEDQYSGIYKATSAHLKKYLEKYGYTPETALKPVCKEVEKMRLDCIAENK